jgi:hypothetical protein
MELLAVVNLGCDKHPIFHGGGLLPGVPDRGIRVLTPCVYAPQGKSAVRPISYLEALVCKDVPETLAKVLVQLPVASDAIHWGFTPGKCLVTGFQALYGGAQIWANAKRDREAGLCVPQAAGTE